VLQLPQPTAAQRGARQSGVVRATRVGRTPAGKTVRRVAVEEQEVLEEELLMGQGSGEEEGEGGEGSQHEGSMLGSILRSAQKAIGRGKRGAAAAGASDQGAVACWGATIAAPCRLLCPA
jgi:hypothetical protein